MQTLVYKRSQLTRVIGMDVPGRAGCAGSGLGLYGPEKRPSELFRKPAAVAALLPMAMIPQSNVGAFVPLPAPH